MTTAIFRLVNHHNSARMELNGMESNGMECAALYRHNVSICQYISMYVFRVVQPNAMSQNAIRRNVRKCRTCWKCSVLSCNIIM